MKRFDDSHFGTILFPCRKYVRACMGPPLFFSPLPAPRRKRHGRVFIRLVSERKGTLIPSGRREGGSVGRLFVPVLFCRWAMRAIQNKKNSPTKPHVFRSIPPDRPTWKCCKPLTREERSQPIDTMRKRRLIGEKIRCSIRTHLWFGKITIDLSPTCHHTPLYLGYIAGQIW